MTRGRGALGTLALAVGAIAFVFALTMALLRLVVARPPPAHLEPTTAPAGPPLTRHLMLVVIDGLRFDFATDPALMPELSRLMRERTSGEIWSNRVSMTSSAILTYATGQRGDVDQIVNNESGKPVAYDHLPGAARRAGLVTAYTGDRAWLKMFPGAWDMSHPDPPGAAIEADYNDEIFAAARQFLGAPTRPALLVAHFVTPDHQAHAYGPMSARYRAHIRAFDATLRALLDDVPADTTVIITSDHGATDTGTHGSDTDVQRRCPIVAWGPGIVQARRESARLDQIDLAATFAVLLGLPSPAHGRGHVLVDWLDVPVERRAEIACNELARLGRAAAAEGGPPAPLESAARSACEAGDPAGRIRAAREAATALDAWMDERGGGSRLGWLVPLFAVAGAAALGWFALRPIAPADRVRRGIAGGVAMCALAVALTWGVELLPGRAPLAVRISLFVVGNGALLALLVWRRRALAAAELRPELAALIVPGLLVASPTRAAQVESLVVAAVIAVVASTVGLGAPSGVRARSPSTWIARGPGAAALVVLVALLAPIGLLEHRFLPSLVLADPRRTFWFACAVVVLFGAHRAMRRARAGAQPAAAWIEAAAGVVIVVVSLWLRKTAPAPVCLAAWLGLPLVALVAWRRGMSALAALSLLGSWAWVSRDAEVPIVVGTWIAATWIGDALREEERRAPGTLASAGPVLGVVALLFAWCFVQRIGVQLGLDFTHFDWGAAAFREQGVSLLRIGVGLAYKHAFARAVVVAAVLAALPISARHAVARGLFAAELARAALLAATLDVCKGSFWTSLRAIGDVPHALAAVVVAAGAVVAVSGPWSVARGRGRGDGDADRSGGDARSLAA